MPPRKGDEDRLAVARHAAALFWQHGVDGTSGDAIAAAGVVLEDGPEGTHWSVNDG